MTRYVTQNYNLDTVGTFNKLNYKIAKTLDGNLSTTLEPFTELLNVTKESYVRRNVFLYRPTGISESNDVLTIENNAGNTKFIQNPSSLNIATDIDISTDKLFNFIVDKRRNNIDITGNYTYRPNVPPSTLLYVRARLVSDHVFSEWSDTFTYTSSANIVYTNDPVIKVAGGVDSAHTDFYISIEGLISSHDFVSAKWDIYDRYDNIFYSTTVNTNPDKLALGRVRLKRNNKYTAFVRLGLDVGGTTVYGNYHKIKFRVAAYPWRRLSKHLTIGNISNEIKTTGMTQYAHCKLPNNKIFVSGGITVNSVTSGQVMLNQSYIYNPDTNIWDKIKAQGSNNRLSIALLLPNGEIFYKMGFLSSSTTPSGSIYHYNMGTNSWALKTNIAGFFGSGPADAVVLSDGKVWILSGDDTNNTTKIYDPSDSSVVAGPNLLFPVSGASTGLLHNNIAYVIGGKSNGINSFNMQLYDHIAGTPVTTGPGLKSPTEFVKSVVLDNSNIFVTHVRKGFNTLETMIYTARDNAWNFAYRLPTESRNYPRGLEKLDDGTILLLPNETSSGDFQEGSQIDFLRP